VSTPKEAARDVERELARLARPAGEFDASRYFRGAADLGFYNVGSGQVRAMAKAIVRAHPAWDVDDGMVFAQQLITDRYLEVKAVAIEVVGCYRRTFTPKLLRAWKRWLADGDSANWATTDSICGTLIGPLFIARPGLAEQMRRWARHRSLWVRRAAAVSLIPAVRRGLLMDIGYDVAAALHADREDLIQKAVGWLLREMGKADEQRLEKYLRAKGPEIPRTTLRYAIERFAPAKRRALLEITRAGGAGGAGGTGRPGKAAREWRRSPPATR